MGLAFFSHRLQQSCSASETPLLKPNDIQQAHSTVQNWGTIFVPHRSYTRIKAFCTGCCRAVTSAGICGCPLLLLVQDSPFLESPGAHRWFLLHVSDLVLQLRSHRFCSVWQQRGDCRPGGAWLYLEPPRSLHRLFGSAALQTNVAQQQLGPTSQPCPKGGSTASTCGAKLGVHLSSPQDPAAVIPPSPSPRHCAAAPAGGCPKAALRASSRIAQGLGSASANSTVSNPFCPVHAHRLD